MRTPWDALRAMTLIVATEPGRPPLPPLPSRSDGGLVPWFDNKARSSRPMYTPEPSERWDRAGAKARRKARRQEMDRRRTMLGRDFHKVRIETPQASVAQYVDAVFAEWEPEEIPRCIHRARRTIGG